MWKTEHPQPTTPLRSVIDTGPIRLSIDQNPDKPKQWQHFCLSFGRHSEDSHNELMSNWPREALRIAREKLTEFEARLDEED